LLLLVAPIAHAEVTVKDAWVRGTVPAQKGTGAFMTLTSSVDARLVGVASPAAKVAEIHASEIRDGVMQMEAIDALALPAGKEVAFKPGGHHVMLLGLTRALAKGEKVPITLTVEEKGGKRHTVQVSADVRPLGAR
jgi:periplasmic copper chaperone A